MGSYPCHLTPVVSSEQFIPEHLFIYMIAGSMQAYDGNTEYNIQAGDYGFAKRNHLIKYVKSAPASGKFEAVSVAFNQQFLKSFSEEYGYTADAAVNKTAITKLDPDPLLDHYLHSLKPYLHLTGIEQENFLSLKNRELLLIALKLNPDLKNELFDFRDPDKIDLESFMNQNFRFNVSMQRFGYLTGRSLTSFKRDFEKIFNKAPGRWLLEKRLQEAYFLMEKKGEKPSDVYHELGFEDLSHFSYAFKKMYGVSPNQLKRKIS